MKKIYDGVKKAKLGTRKRPALIKVQTEERARELEAVFKENGWHHKIEQDPDRPEDIAELELLLNPPQTRVAEKTPGRNAPCPCGSGKKTKKCCG